MTPSPSTTENPAIPGSGARCLVASVATATALGGVYALGLNRNLLYLSLLASVALVLCVLLQRVWTLALALAACVYAACAPVTVPEMGAVYPAPRFRPGMEALWVHPLAPGQTWTFPFILTASVGSAALAESQGRLFVDGHGLAGVAIHLQGRTLESARYLHPKSGFDHLEIPLEGVAPGTLEVGVEALPGSHASIFHGPEVHGFQEYGDAVWLEFDHGRDRAVFHALRHPAR